MSKLGKKSLEWALKHVRKYADTDKFPVPFELDILVRQKASVLPILEKIDISNHLWRPARHVLVNKDEVSYRPAVQLDPIDAVLFAALVHENGRKIEKLRAKPAAQTIFSYRYAPTSGGRLYGEDLWSDFWTRSGQLAAARGVTHVVTTDISDFYNQVSHHSLENLLLKAKVEGAHKTAFMNLIGRHTEKISKGIPIGPHPSHLLGELALTPIDDFLAGSGLSYCRYVDDFHIFCGSREAARVALYDLAKALDKPHRLVLNRSKTSILSVEDFLQIVRDRLDDHPINEHEEAILDVLKGHSRSPYSTVRIADLSDEEFQKFDQPLVEGVLAAYLDAERRDYTRLRYFLRRLTQVGAPGGVELVVRRFEDFYPSIADAATYLASAQGNYQGDWARLGGDLLRLLDLPLVQRSEYIQLVLLGLFGQVAQLNHIDKLLSRYSASAPPARRKIVLAAATAKAVPWLQQRKDEVRNLDPWTKRAVLFAGRLFEKDERKFWLGLHKPAADPLDLQVIEAAMGGP